MSTQFMEACFLLVSKHLNLFMLQGKSVPDMIEKKILYSIAFFPSVDFIFFMID